MAFDGWTDSYNMNLNHRMPITLISEPYINASVNLQYMAVGISYGVDLNNLCFNKPVRHQKFEFDSTARVSISTFPTTAMPEAHMSAP